MLLYFRVLSLSDKYYIKCNKLKNKKIDKDYLFYENSKLSVPFNVFAFIPLFQHIILIIFSFFYLGKLIHFLYLKIPKHKYSIVLFGKKIDNPINKLWSFWISNR